jgi:hypothetical protein
VGKSNNSTLADFSVTRCNTTPGTTASANDNPPWL